MAISTIDQTGLANPLTPNAITLTNANGLPLTTGVTGVLPVANGGTNRSTALAVCWAYNSSSSSNFADATSNKVNYNATTYDNYSGFNTSTNTYTCQVAGTYLVTAKIRFRQASGGQSNQFLTYIYKNGSSVATTEQDGNNIYFWGYTVTNMWTGTLAVNDTIAVYGLHSTGNGSNQYYYPNSDCVLTIQQIA